jgi:DNA-binding HxlR family transcriptional regulator
MLEINEAKLNSADCNQDFHKLHLAFMLLQEKWVLFIVHNLMKGPLGFNELGRTGMSVNSTTLSQRLSLLERAGLVSRTVHSTIPPRTSYELTEAGLALCEIFEPIQKWAEQYLPDPPADAHADCPSE